MFGKDNEFLNNAKDPKLRERFLQHVGNENGIGVLEEKNLNVSIYTVNGITGILNIKLISVFYRSFVKWCWLVIQLFLRWDFVVTLVFSSK